MNKNISILSVVIAIVILLRCIFDGNENLLYIVAGINIVAIVFVLYTIIEKTVDGITNNIRESNAPKQIIVREVKTVRFKMWGWSIGVSIIAVIAYLSLWCSNLGNDIISILALGLSILDDEMVKGITENYKI